jgi:hypothetical protein
MCKQTKELNEYYKLSHTKCRECTLIYNKKYVTKHRNNNPELYRKYKISTIEKDRNTINEYKQNSGCKKCNEKRFWVLDFHHIDPSQKSFTIGNDIKYKSLEEKLIEVEKCIVLCSNCHRDFHYQEKQNKITLIEYLAK